MRWMSDDLDSRIFFTLKNHVVLQCVLKYLDVVNKIQFLTFLKLNRGWSYKDNIITVGENWDVVFLLLCFFPPQNRHLNKNKPFPKCEFFTQIVAFSLNLLQANCPSIYLLTKAWQQWNVKSEVKWRAGSPNPVGLARCPAGHLHHRFQPGLLLLLSSPERVLQLQLLALPLLEDGERGQHRESIRFRRRTPHRLPGRWLWGSGTDIDEDWWRLTLYFTSPPSNEISRTTSSWCDGSRSKSTTSTCCYCITSARAPQPTREQRAGTPKLKTQSSRFETQGAGTSEPWLSLLYEAWVCGLQIDLQKTRAHRLPVMWPGPRTFMRA